MKKKNTAAIIRIALLPVIFAIFFIPFPFHRAVCAVIILISFFAGFAYKGKKSGKTVLGAFLSVLADRATAASALVLILATGLTPVLFNGAVSTAFIYIEIAEILVISCLQLIAATKNRELSDCSAEGFHEIIRTFVIVLLLTVSEKNDGGTLIVMTDSLYQAVTLVTMLMSLFACGWAIIMYSREFAKPMNVISGKKDVSKTVRKDYDTSIDDELIKRGRAVAQKYGYASARRMQRELGIGYYRACALITLLTQSGELGAADDSGTHKYIGKSENV